MNADEEPINAEFDLLTGEAYRRYRNSLPLTVKADLDLYETVIADAPLMRVLYLAALDLDPAHVDHSAGVSPTERAEVRARGWIHQTATSTHLTREGFATWRRWQATVTANLHKPPFLDLWKRVCGW